MHPARSRSRSRLGWWSQRRVGVPCAVTTQAPSHLTLRPVTRPQSPWDLSLRLLALPHGGPDGSHTVCLSCRTESQHRFWKPSEVDTELDGALVSQVPPSRLITFAGTFEPVQHQCRAPRPDGQLCKRQDRLKVRRQPGPVGQDLVA